MPAAPLAVAALVVANLVPLAGVLFLGWGLYDVVFLYWLENGVVGAFMLARVATAHGAWPAALFLGPFFLVHYGLFWVVHGVFVVTLFGPQGPPIGGPSPPLPASSLLELPLIGPVPSIEGGGWALLGLVISHALSFVQNWWLGGERETTGPSEVPARAYGRVVTLHLALLGGGFAVLALGAPVLALVVLVVAKIALDLRAHLSEHRAPVA